MGIGQLFVRKLHIMRPALKCTFQPENVVCTHKQDSSIKIIDFGLAKHLGPDDKVR
jgi:serine/threonine protein kinase